MPAASVAAIKKGFTSGSIFSLQEQWADCQRCFISPSAAGAVKSDLVTLSAAGDGEPRHVAADAVAQFVAPVADHARTCYHG